MSSRHPRTKLLGPAAGCTAALPGTSNPFLVASNSRTLRVCAWPRTLSLFTMCTEVLSREMRGCDGMGGERGKCRRWKYKCSPYMSLCHIVNRSWDAVETSFVNPNQYKEAGARHMMSWDGMVNTRANTSLPPSLHPSPDTHPWHMGCRVCR